MIDFPIMPEHTTKFMWVLGAFMYFVIFVVFYIPGTSNRQTNTSALQKYTFVALFFIFVLCAFYCGDWVHYQAIVKGYSGEEYVEGYGLERIYYYIISLVNQNYLLFRLIVWGTGLICLLQCFKQYDVDPYKCLFFLFAVYFTAYAYTRAAVAMSVYYMGYSLVFQNKNKRKNISIILGVLLILASVSLHRSLLVLVALTPFVVIPIRKRTFPLLCMAMFVVLLLFDTIFESAIGTLLEADEYSHRLELYEGLSGEASLSFSLSGFFFLWYKAIVHVPFWYAIAYIYKYQEISIIPNNIQYIFRFSILLYAFFMMMLFKYGSMSVFYYRYEGMLYIPICIMIGYLYQYKIMPERQYKFLFWFCSLSFIKDFIWRVLFW